ncbi:MAG TPA: hypothetical protein VF458_00885, partial [Ktedonobacteraceae bacterium]
ISIVASHYLVTTALRQASSSEDMLRGAEQALPADCVRFAPPGRELRHIEGLAGGLLLGVSAAQLHVALDLGQALGD